jgi:hypothetical protein
MPTVSTVVSHRKDKLHFTDAARFPDTLNMARSMKEAEVGMIPGLWRCQKCDHQNAEVNTSGRHNLNLNGFSCGLARKYIWFDVFRIRSRGTDRNVPPANLSTYWLHYRTHPFAAQARVAAGESQSPSAQMHGINSSVRG